jgi:hypothetical protein
MHENEPSPSNQPEHLTSEQIPHSGIHYDERPVDEFDHTSLPDAVERGLVNPMPDTPAGLEQTESTEKKSHKKLVIGGAAFLAGAAVIAGSVIGLKAAGDAPKNALPAPDPKATSHTPEATPTAQPEVLTVQSAEIPAGLTPEQLGTTLIDRLSSWDMAGATAANRDAYFAEGAKTGNANTYATQVSESNGDIYAEALFGPNWQSVPILATYVPNEKIANADIIELWFKTSSGTSGLDTSPFRNWDTVDSVTVVSQNATSVTEHIDVTSNNNAGQGNRAETLAPGTAAQNGEKFVVKATFTTVGGVEKISNFDIIKP